MYIMEWETVSPRRYVSIQQLRPDRFAVSLDEQPIGEMDGVAAWRFRNSALGYHRYWLEDTDEEFFGLPALVVADARHMLEQAL